jgi:hypothetical protein
LEKIIIFLGVNSYNSRLINLFKSLGLKYKKILKKNQFYFKYKKVTIPAFIDVLSINWEQKVINNNINE